MLTEDNAELTLTLLEEEALKTFGPAKTALVVWKRVTPRMSPAAVYKALVAIRARWEKEGKC